MRGDHRGRQRTDHERNFKQINKEFTFDFKYDGKSLGGFKQGSYMTSFEF